MKEQRIGLTAKITTLCIIVILSSMIILLILITDAFRQISIGEVYYRLNSYSDITANTWQNGEEVRPQNIDHYGIIQGEYNEGNINIKYQHFLPNLSDEEMNKFINNLEVGNNFYISNEGETYYYTFSVDADSNNYIVIFVSDYYSIDFTQRVMSRITLQILIIIGVFAIIIVTYMHNFASRIVRLNSHVLSMSKDNYKTPYIEKDKNDELSQLAESVEKMRAEIEQSETSKREMLQNISHDLKTPIAVIKNYAESIEDGFAVEESSKIIVKQADILISKVNQLLQYNKLEYLSKDNEFVNINLKDICLDVINNFNKQNKIEFISNLEDCYFKGYRENYTTVISNIVDNALRYAKSKIIITTKQNKVTIYNDGPYIEEQFTKAEFKPYEKGSKGQFGLGMSIVLKTLNFFDLNLKVYNEPYGGVSFVISPNKNSRT